MAKKKKSQPTKQVQAKGNKVTVEVTAEMQIKEGRAKRRNQEIASGVNLMSGSGVHGGHKKESNKRDRRSNKAKLRKGEE
jgi:hypothetical protein